MYEQTQSGLLVPVKNAVSEYRHDAWANDLSGMGAHGMDKTIHTGYNLFGAWLGQQRLSTMYRTDWLTRKICDRPAKDATRKFIQCSDIEAHKFIEKFMDKLKFRQKVKKAVQWSRLFGGAGLVFITNGRDSEDELSANETLYDVEVYDRYYLNPVAYDMDPRSANYRKPLVYQTVSGQRFHHSRVAKFSGCELTYEDAVENSFWGGSLIECYWNAVRNFQATQEDVRYIMTELNIGILKLPNLTQIKTNGGAAAAIQRRVNKFNATKSNQRVAAIDKEEDFSFVSRTLTGVSDVMDRFATAVSGATEMPELILFGKTPAGLNASQEEQLTTYYDLIEDIRQDQIAPAIDKFMMLHGAEDEEWEFQSLWEMSDSTKATVMQTSSAAIPNLLMAGIAPEDVIKNLNMLGVWNFNTEDEAAPNMLEDE